MRIGIVCYPTFGGSGVVATELGRWLARRAHQIHFMSYDRPFRLTMVSEPNLHFHKVDLLDYPVFPSPSYTLSLAVKIADIAQKEKLDVIHVHYAVPHAVSAYLARQMCKLCHTAVVTTLHGTDVTLGQNPALLPVIQLAIEQSEAVTAVSQWLRDQTVAQLGISRTIEVVPNFVDAEAFHPHSAQCPMRQFVRDDEKRIVHVSNFRPIKRVRDIVRAFAMIRREIPARLILVGDGPERESVEQLARELEVFSHIVFTGSRTMTHCFYTVSHLFMYASESESFGLAALEAMSCEIPVVGYAGGGLPELIREGETGCLVPVGDAETLAKRALEILRAPDRAQAFGKRARQIVLERYQPAQIVSRYESIYDQALKSL